MVDRSIIGKQHPGPTMVVERGKVMEFARSILEDDPAYFDEDPPIPLTFTVTIAHWSKPTADDPLLASLDMTRVLHGGHEFEYLAEMHVGDVLTTRGGVVDIYDKEGSRGGTMTFIESETVFTNQHGVDVLKTRSTLIQTSQPAT
jgi:hypothetical protein